MAPGVDPHLFRPTPSQLRLLRQADLILANGHHLEGQMVEALAALGRTKPVLMLAEQLPAERLVPLPEAPGHFDPHFWFDIDLWQRAGTALLDWLTRQTAGTALPTTSSPLDAWQRELRSLAEWARAELGQVPPGQRVLITAHDAFHYFGRYFGFEVVALQGVSTESEAGLADVRRVRELVAARGIRAIFTESTLSPRLMQAVQEGARAAGVETRIGGEIYGDSLGPVGSGAETWVGMMRHNITTIRDGLLGRVVGTGAGTDEHAAGG